MEQNEILLSIQRELTELKRALQYPSVKNPITDKWVSRYDAMRWLNYGPTQMAALEKSGELIVSKVGKRKFIFRTSIEKWLERNVVNKID